MTNLKKSFWTSFIVLLCFIFIFLLFRLPKTVEGIVFDCQTNEPISGVNVELLQRGWNIDKAGLSWEHPYTYSTVTDQAGHYRITFNVGDSAHFRLTKEEYLHTEHWEYPGSNIRIGMVKNLGITERDKNFGYVSNCEVYK